MVAGKILDTSRGVQLVLTRIELILQGGFWLRGGNRDHNDQDGQRTDFADQTFCLSLHQSRTSHAFLPFSLHVVSQSEADSSSCPLVSVALPSRVFNLPGAINDSNKSGFIWGKQYSCL